MGKRKRLEARANLQSWFALDSTATEGPTNSREEDMCAVLSCYYVGARGFASLRQQDDSLTAATSPRRTGQTTTCSAPSHRYRALGAANASFARGSWPEEKGPPLPRFSPPSRHRRVLQPSSCGVSTQPGRGDARLSPCTPCPLITSAPPAARRFRPPSSPRTPPKARPRARAPRPGTPAPPPRR